MGSIVGAKVGTLSARKSKGERNNKEFVQGSTSKEGMGFWRKMGVLLSCVSLNFKREEGSSSDHSKQSDGTKSTNDDVRHQPHTPSSSSNKRSRRYAKSCTPNLKMELQLASPHLRRFTFDDLKLATSNFKAENFLGEGGFGVVLKGWVSVQHGSYTRPVPIAVKNLNINGHQGHREWLAEITYLSELHHPNLIKLVGFCIEDDKRLLAYEFMRRGSFENHLFNRSVCLPWPTRMKIVIGAAKGLAFLHEKDIIFRDFKTSNILLDEDYNAKLSDFGLATDAPKGDATHVSIEVMGTQGYTAPDYIMTGHLTSKSDVYSFGIVLLEVLTGRRAIEKRLPKEQQNLVEWLRLLFRKKTSFRYMMDSRLHYRYSMVGAEMTMKLAINCVRPDPKTRPHMSEVVRTLESLPLRGNAMTNPSTSTSTPSIPSTLLNRMHVGPSNHTNKYGLRTGQAPNVPRRFQASPLSQDNLVPQPNPSAGPAHE